MVPELSMTKIPRSDDVGKFISIKGTIIRTGMIKMLEISKIFHCATCKQHFVCRYDIEQFNTIPKPIKCLASSECEGTKFKPVETDSGKFSNVVNNLPVQVPMTCIDYQEVKIQEQVNRLSVGTIPKSMVVVLENDLVDTCKAGDDVTIKFVNS